jgi:hypothetical protein
MRKLKFFLISIMVLSIFISCGGKKEVKPQPPEARKAEEGLRVIEKIKEYYVSKELEKIKDLTTAKGYLSFIGSVREFEKATVMFTPRWIEIERDEMTLYIDWSGTWTVKGKEYKRNGLAAFKLRSNPLLLDEILRANPFSEPK